MSKLLAAFLLGVAPPAGKVRAALARMYAWARTRMRTRARVRDSDDDHSPWGV